MVQLKEKAFEYPIRIIFRGMYDYDGLLKLLRSYFFRHEFDLYEPKFKYKTGGEGTEVNFKMKGERETTQYLQIKMELEGQIMFLSRKKVIRNGKPEILTHGLIDFKITGEWILDYADQFAKHGSKSQKRLEGWMQRFLDRDPDGLQRTDMEREGEDYLRNTMRSFADEIKSFLGMTTMVKQE